MLKSQRSARDDRIGVTALLTGDVDATCGDRFSDENQLAVVNALMAQSRDERGNTSVPCSAAWSCSNGRSSHRLWR